MCDETVCALVVSYNRKKLLYECLNALINQTKALNAICIIDNASNDGTPQFLFDRGFLNKLPPLNSDKMWETSFKTKNFVDGVEIKLIYIRMSENVGGAGGFHEGLKRSYSENYNWIWLMDDDTIPCSNSLENLLNKRNLIEEDIGFICSKVLWKGKEIHLMNIPSIHSLNENIPFNKYDENSILIVKTASFVSLLLKTNMISEFGLPFKEFFIWGDDVEYTDRITDGRYLGIYASDSIVCHNTKKNYSANILNDSIQNSWKYSFGVRNNLYMKKKKSLIIFLAHVIYNLTYFNYTILKLRKNNKIKFLGINIKSSLKSIFFRPKREYI